MWYLRVVKLCECRKKLVDKLVEEYSENVDEVEISGITLVEYENQCKPSCTLYTVLLLMIFTINIGNATYFVYYKHMNHSKKRRC